MNGDARQVENADDRSTAPRGTRLVSGRVPGSTIRASWGPPSASLRGYRAQGGAQCVPRGWRQGFRGFFVAVAAEIHGAQGNDLQGAEAPAKAQTTGRILPRAVDAGVTSVRVYRLSRPGSPQRGTVRGVGTNPCEETAPCSERTPHSDIPSAHVVPGRHGPSAPGPNGFCLSRLPHSTE